MKRVLAFGSFDVLHVGHVYFFKQAKKLGDELIVVIARDSSVRRIKGKKPFFTDVERKVIVGALKPVDRAVLGNPHDFFTAIRRFKPQVLVLGYDQQTISLGAIRNKLNSLGLYSTRIVRLKPHGIGKHKSSNIRSHYAF